MENKPSVYGFCNAGCKWETVHKDEFLKSASVAKMGLDDDNRVTFAGGTYFRVKIKGNVTNIVLRAEVIGGGAPSYLETITIPDEYYDKGYTYFEVWSWRKTSVSTGVQIDYSYEISNGFDKRLQQTQSKVFTGTQDPEGFNSQFIIQLADNECEVYIYNTEAEIRGADGIDGISALIYNGQVTSDTVLSVDSTKLLYQPNFSRLPIEGDFTTFTLLVNDTDIYNVVAEITTINTSRPPSTAEVYCIATVRYINKLNNGLPSVTTADAGKFLRVNASGAWVAESVPSAEGVEF